MSIDGKVTIWMVNNLHYIKIYPFLTLPPKNESLTKHLSTSPIVTLNYNVNTLFEYIKNRSNYFSKYWNKYTKPKSDRD